MFYSFPTGLAEIVVKRRMVNGLKVYLVLKQLCNGRIIITPKIKNEIAVRLNLSTRTVENSIKKLLQINWLGYDPNTGFTYVRGFDTLRKIEDLKSRRSVTLNVKHITRIGEFIWGVIFSDVVVYQKMKLWKESAKGARKKEMANQPSSLPKFFEVAIRYIELKHDIPRSTVQRGKASAIKAGFIMCENRQPLRIEYPYLFLRGYPEYEGSLFFYNGKAYLRQTDLIQTKLTFCKRPSITKIRRKND